MKLKTSCFEPAISHAYWKRFAPLSVLYAIGMLVLTIGSLNAQSYITAAHCVQSLCSAVVACNLVYAAVAAQLLAGDLYTPRLSYALYALPVTIGGWFGTQVVLGILSVLPGILLSGVAMAMLLTAYRITIVIWMLCALLSFLFFYGAALLSSVCAGNRLGMLLVYGILNFAGLFVRWTRVHIFGSLSYGLYIPTTTMQTVPYAGMVGGLPFDLDYNTSATEEMLTMSQREIYFSSAYCPKVNFSGNLWLYALYAALGCVLIGLAVYLLHKRKPERAGDLLAFRVTEPVILVVSALFCGIMAHLLSYTLGFDLDYPLLFVGIVLGYYAALMLLKRQVNVFTLKSLPTLLIMLIVVLASLVAYGLDVFGTTYKVPQADEVESVSVYSPTVNSYNPLNVLDEDGIAQVIAMHQECLDDHRQVEESKSLLERIFGNEEESEERTASDGSTDHSAKILLEYTMKDGSILLRNYTVYASFECTEFLRDRFSAPEFVFTTNFQDENGKLDTELLRSSLLSAELYIYGFDEEGEYHSKDTYLKSEELSGLLDALLADCEACTIAQGYFLHSTSSGTGESEWLYLTLTYENPDSTYNTADSIYIYPDCTNTLKFLASHGYSTTISDIIAAKEAS